jgi:hypothetical protein
MQRWKTLLETKSSTGPDNRLDSPYAKMAIEAYFKS